jgi:hypothetical protein
MNNTESRVFTARAVLILACTPADVLHDLRAGRWQNASLEMQPSSDEPVVHQTTFISRSLWSPTAVVEGGRRALGDAQRAQSFAEDGTAYGMGGHCSFCHDNFAHQAMGIAYRIQIIDGVYQVAMSRTVCCFECALELLKQIPRNSIEFSKFRHSGQYLDSLHQWMYPDAPPLISAQPPELHIRQGGPLTERQYRDMKQTRFIPTQNLVVVPTVQPYVSMNLT